MCVLGSPEAFLLALFDHFALFLFLFQVLLPFSIMNDKASLRSMCQLELVRRAKKK